MDLGSLSGLHGLGECSDGGFATLASSDPETRSKLYGSGVILKQEDDLRSIKMAKTSDDDFSASKGMMLLQQRSNGLVLRSDVQSQQQMLCFSSSPKSETMFMERSSQSAAAFPYFHHSSSSTPAYGGNTGYSRGSINGATSILSGLRGPFTPSQWMELEHQALIYKYITANMPIPSNLLNPIKRALDSVSFSPFTGHSLRPTSLGWGSFHVGFSNSTDPEPGRCRRTDGKKWRCSRDAVADAKYCERHMNRGRHRSRKPVEGQTGQSAARNAAATTATGPMPVVSSSAPAVVSGAGGGASNSLANVQPEVKNLHPGRASNPSVATHLNGCRVYLNKENVGDRMEDSAGLSMLPPAMNLKPKETPFSISKESSRTDFGLVSSDSLLNPSHKNLSFTGFQNFTTSHDPSDREPESQHSLRPFIDNWPKNQLDRSSIFWPEVGSQLDQTQLSISIPSNNKVTLSPLKLSREIDPIQMGLGVGNGNETVKKQANWIPTQWGTSVGGPLGEVLHSTNNSSGGECKDTSALSLGTDGWEGSSPCLGSSPTGVLQKTAFGSLSNSSAGSSPRPEISKTHEAFFTASALTGDL